MYSVWFRRKLEELEKYRTEAECGGAVQGLPGGKKKQRKRRGGGFLLGPTSLWLQI